MGKRKYLIGVDLGGTKMLAGLLDRDFRLLASEKNKVQVSEGAKPFLEVLAESIRMLLKDYKITSKQVLGIGIGCPGIIDREKGIVLSSPNIPFLEHYPLAKKIKKIFDLPVSLGNDVNVGLLGEQRLGAAKGHRDVIGIFVGTGVGGALIFNDELYEGISGGAGEIGHMVAEPDGILCGCGNRGCLETLVGRVGIASEAAMLAARQKAPHLYKEVQGDVTKIKSGVLAKAIKAGDKSIRDLVEHRAQKLGLAMANVVNLLNPEVIVLGGGVMEALGHLMIPAAEKTMRRNAMAPLAKKVRVVPAKLGDFAIVKGGAVMMLEDREGRI